MLETKRWGMLTEEVEIPSKAPLDDDFIHDLSQLFEAYKFERSAVGSLIVAPCHTEGGEYSANAYFQLRRWKEDTGAGGRVYGPDTGFNFPDTSMLAPDATWLSDATIDALTPEQREGYWHVVPDVAIEMRSATDRWKRLCAKVDGYAANGVGFAIAIDPKSGESYEKGTPPAGLRAYLELLSKAR